MPAWPLCAASSRCAVARGGAKHARYNGVVDKPMRLRAAKDRLKIEHSIIDGVRDFLERLLADTPEIRSVIPGVIRQVRDARGRIQVRITVPVQNGWKAIALSAGARQELFISTTMRKEELEQAFERALAHTDPR
jgi:hypothetical protein